MAYEEVQDFTPSTTINVGGDDRKTGKKNPLELEGYYVGQETLTGGKFGPSTRYLFKTPKGVVGVWKRGNMGRLFDKVALGTMVTVLFTGMVEKPGKNPSYGYKMKQDSTNTIKIDAGLGRGKFDNGTPDETQDSYDTGNDADEELDNDYEEETPVRAAPPKSASQARVQELLNKKR